MQFTLVHVIIMTFYFIVIDCNFISSSPQNLASYIYTKLHSVWTVFIIQSKRSLWATFFRSLCTDSYIKRINIMISNEFGDLKLIPGLLFSIFYLLCFWVVLKNLLIMFNIIPMTTAIMTQFVYDFIIFKPGAGQPQAGARLVS